MTAPPSGQPLLYYLHIFKNAGNTMREVLWRNRGAGEFIDVMLYRRMDQRRCPQTFDSQDDDVRELRDLITDNICDLSYVAADMPFGIHRYVPRPVRYLTVLREPVDRLISYWYFAYNARHQTKLQRSMWDVIEEHGFDVYAAVEKGGLIHYSNDQTRCVLGSDKIVLGADDLLAAQDLIAGSYDLVGTVARLGDFLRVLAGREGWQADWELPRLNVGDRSDRSLLPAGAIAAFRELNEIDAALYRWVEDTYLPAVIG
jgi:Sulfotransferase family